MKSVATSDSAMCRSANASEQIHGIAKASIEITGNRPVISLIAIGDVEVEGRADIFRETDERMALLIPALLPFLRGVKDSSVWVHVQQEAERLESILQDCGYLPKTVSL